MSTELMWTIIITVGLLVMLAIGTPIYAVFGVVAVATLSQISRSTLPGIPLVMWEMGTNFGFVSILLFILMGNVLAATGIGKRLYSMAYAVFGSRPGGLAVSTTVANAFFGAMCGSAYAATATFGSFAYREMTERGYNSSFASGAIAGAAVLSPIIPPSISLIIYGAMSGESIGALFMAGIIPGIIMAALFITYQVIAVRRNPSLGPGMSLNMAGSERVKSIVTTLPAMVIIVIVIGSIYIGFASPSEVAAVGAVAAIVLAICYARKVQYKILSQVFLQSVRTSSFILLLMVTGRVLALTFAALGLGQMIAAATASLPSWAVVMVFVLIIVALGFIMDGGAILVLTTPIMYPVILSIGYDPVAFGVILCLGVVIGVFTPPVCISVYILNSVTKEPVGNIIRGSMPYVYLIMIVVVLLAIFPQVSTVLAR